MLMTRPNRRAGIFAALHRINARIAAIAAQGSGAIWWIVAFALLHALLWAAALTLIKGFQDVHMDVAEAFQWGQSFRFGYGKHPPLSGWVAGAWFRLFPVTDFAAYLLASVTLGVALIVNWLIASRVADGRRALLAVVLLAIYPIFNVKGFKYNTDILQLVTLSLVVLAFLHAFSKRTLLSGVWLGIAAALAMMTKYWAFLVIGAVGLSALLHPLRWQFLRSAAPWAAMVVFVAGMLPHVGWLNSVDFQPFTYAGGVYQSTLQWALHSVRMYLSHNVAMLIPVALALIVALGIKPSPFTRQPARGFDRSMAFHVWIILIALAIVPPVMGVAKTIYMKTDWGIPLFFLFPLALLLIPRLRVPRVALGRALAVWLIFTIGALIASPWIAKIEFRNKPDSQSVYGARSELAHMLTLLWRNKFNTSWPAVAAVTELSATLSFYSPDHPATLVPGEAWESGMVTTQQAKQSGFIGLCAEDDPVRGMCEAWMAEHAPQAERREIALRRRMPGMTGPVGRWQVYIAAPQAKAN